MSAAPLRRNPRRPFHLTPAGLKRIVLGETGDGGSAAPLALHREAAPKPLRLQADPSANLLVIAYSDRGVLDPQAQQAIAAAALLADPQTAVAVLVLGELTEDLAAFGADTVFVRADRDKSLFDPAADLAIALELVSRLSPRHILLSDSNGSDSDLGRRLAASLNCSVAGHVAELKPDGVTAYWQGGATMAQRDLPRLLLLEADTTDPVLPFRGRGSVEAAPPPTAVDNPYTDLGSPAVDPALLSLEEADFIVAAGNGVRDVSTLAAVAKTFDAAIGASRVAVDDGKFRRDQQIGATGKTASASVYLAIGISGAVQHLQGIRACRHVIAINTDASAPIAARADLTIVDDAQAVMEQLLIASRGRNITGQEGATDSLPLPHLAPQGRELALGPRPEGRRAAAGEGWDAATERDVTAWRASTSPDIAAPTPPPNLPHQGGGADRGSPALVASDTSVDTLPLVGRDQGRGANKPDAAAGTPLDASTPRILVLAASGRNPVNGTPRANRNDVLALELARQLSPDVTLLHAAPDNAATADYLAYGATALDHLPTTPEHDIAKILAEQATGHDLILAGTRAEGGEGSGLVPYLVAEALGLPIVAQAIAITVADGHAEVTQALAKGQRRQLRVALPAVVVVHPGAPVTPRYAYARRLSGKVQTLPAPTLAPEPSAWHTEPATRRPVKFKAAETKAGHARMLSAIVAPARGGAVLASGSAADKAQAILDYLRRHQLIDW
ncbi:MAG: FAD-binding protein [Devosia sp.]